jgi:hypothetical protein
MFSRWYDAIGRFVAVRGCKKRDWLRAETANTQENQRSRRCLSQFFHRFSVLC